MSIARCCYTVITDRRITHRYVSSTYEEVQDIQVFTTVWPCGTCKYSPDCNFAMVVSTLSDQ